MAGSARRRALIAASLAAAGCAPPVRADEAPVPAETNTSVPQWMLGASGGTTDREGDDAHVYGALALTRRLDHGTVRAYVRASVTRFGAALRQGEAELPSTYTIGYLSAGASAGHVFLDAYAALGTQRYRPARTPLGLRPPGPENDSGVVGAGGDIGYVHWLTPSLSLAPSASVQFVRFTARRERIGPAGPEEYETRETGTTLGATLRADRVFGHDRTSSVGVRVSRFRISNVSAVLAAGPAGDGAASSRGADGWTELGTSAVVGVRRNLYLDLALARTLGAAFGDLTTTALGVRVLF